MEKNVDLLSKLEETIEKLHEETRSDLVRAPNEEAYSKFTKYRENRRAEGSGTKLRPLFGDDFHTILVDRLNKEGIDAHVAYAALEQETSLYLANFIKDCFKKHL